MSLPQTQPAHKRVTKTPEQRREDIMDAALRVFLQKGTAGATVSDITEAAGVAKGTFYLYFDSKESLLWALKMRFVDELIAHASSFAERIGQDDWWALAEATAEGWIDFALEHRDHIKVFRQEGVTPETFQPFAECDAKMHAMLVAGIQAGCDAGVFDCADPDLAARFLTHALEGTVERAILFGEDIDRDRMVAGSKDLMHRVLGGRPPGR